MTEITNYQSTFQCNLAIYFSHTYSVFFKPSFQTGFLYNVSFLPEGWTTIKVSTVGSPPDGNIWLIFCRMSAFAEYAFDEVDPYV